MIKLKHILLFLSLSFFAGCSRESSVDDPVVARVGDSVITASDFKSNYDFGLSHLKKGADPKRTFLGYMIKERVLSQQGYALGLDQAEPVQKALDQLMDELLIEQLFLDQVHSKIKISGDEIKEALNKSKISWKFRYWVEPTFAGANIVANAMRERGYSEVVEDFLRRSPETPLSPKDFESDYVTWLDVPEDMLEAIKDLPRGEISQPFEMNGVYYILQITDIRRQGILESEYADKASSMKKILFYRKVIDQGFKYVSDLMTPKQVVTKSEPFRLLADALAVWKKSDGKMSFRDSIDAADESLPDLYNLKSHLADPLVQFEGGQWKVADFIQNYLDVEQLKSAPDDKTSLMAELKNQIGLSIRNWFLLKEARKRGLDKSKQLLKELSQWRDKWVYQETRYHYTRGVKVTTEQMKEFFEKNKTKYQIRKDKEPTFNQFKNQIRQDTYLAEIKKLLTAKIDSLSGYIPVEINDAVLDTIKVVETPKSKWMSVQLFKRSSNRAAFPTVDPAWGF